MDRLLSLLRQRPSASAGVLAAALILLELWARGLSGGPGPAGAAVAGSADNVGNTEVKSTNHPVADRLAAGPALTGRNLFLVNLEQFPVADFTHHTSTAAEGMAKSPPVRADQTRQQTALAADAAGLVVSGIVMGTAPTARVNGMVVTPGDAIGRFRVARIQETGIVVERDGTQIEIPCR